MAISEVVGVDAPDPADFMVLDLDGVQGVPLRGGGRRDCEIKCTWDGNANEVLRDSG